MAAAGRATAVAMTKPTGYPSKAKVRQAISWAREFGIDVAGFEMSPTGTIRVFDARDGRAEIDEFEAWAKAGKL